MGAGQQPLNFAGIREIGNVQAPLVQDGVRPPNAQAPVAPRAREGFQSKLKDASQYEETDDGAAEFQRDADHDRRIHDGSATHEQAEEAHRLDSIKYRIDLLENLEKNGLLKPRQQIELDMLYKEYDAARDEVGKLYGQR